MKSGLKSPTAPLDIGEELSAQYQRLFELLVALCDKYRPPTETEIVRSVWVHNRKAVERVMDDLAVEGGPPSTATEGSAQSLATSFTIRVLAISPFSASSA